MQPPVVDAGATDADLELRLGEVQRYARRVGGAVVIGAFAAYALAWYVWTLGQGLGAIVIASMGYLLFRALRKIAFNLTLQAFDGQPAHAGLLARLDPDLILRKPATVLERLRAPQGGEPS